MRFPSFTPTTLLLTAALLAMVAPGCAADTSDAPAAVDDGPAVDELNASSLRGATALKGSVAAGSSITVHYDRTDKQYPRSVPYIAVEILASPSTHTAGLHPMNGEVGLEQQITVTGEFPGAPKVLLVDDSFNVIAQQVARSQPDGSDLAVIAAPRSTRRRFVLTRDARWTKPMQFQVHVGP